MQKATWKVNINRAILEAAAPFNNLGKVAEEYLTNSLDAFETVIHDNPSENIERQDCKIEMIIHFPTLQIIFKDEHLLMGMSSDIVVSNFFKLHNTNMARERYINVRGKYGTGKSAAFGIQAEKLIVDTVFESKRTTVESTYKSLEDDSIPAQINIKRLDEKTDLPNGTKIIIELPDKRHLQLRSISSAEEHIKKIFGAHLNRYDVRIITIYDDRFNIETHRLVYQPREAVYEKIYEVPDEVANVIGKTNLIVRRAAEPMEETEENGISITSKGYLREQTLFGLENKTYANHFFGEWEISSLDNYRGPNPPWLSTRELRLNKENDMVKLIYEFGKKILEEEITNFAKNEKARKQDETLQRLSHMADELATILNEDFAEFEEISKMEKGERGNIDASKTNPSEGISTTQDSSSNILSPLGSEIQVEQVDKGDLYGTLTQGDLPVGGTGKGGNSEIHAGELENKFVMSPEQLKPNVERRINKRVKVGGGFVIRFELLNHNAFMARVDTDTKIIVVNMDSEAMKTHLKNCSNNIDLPSFKMFAYSAAIDEYSRYVTYLMAIGNEFYGSVTEAVQEAAKEMQLTKKRVLDKLANILESDWLVESLAKSFKK